MGWNVKPSDVDGFPGAISLGRVVAIDNETGEERLEFRISPGESVPETSTSLNYRSHEERPR